MVSEFIRLHPLNSQMPQSQGRPGLGGTADLPETICNQTRFRKGCLHSPQHRHTQNEITLKTEPLSYGPLWPATPKVAGSLFLRALVLGVCLPIGLQRLVRLSAAPLIQDLISLEMVIPSELANTAWREGKSWRDDAIRWAPPLLPIHQDIPQVMLRLFLGFLIQSTILQAVLSMRLRS